MPAEQDGEGAGFSRPLLYSLCPTSRDMGEGEERKESKNEKRKMKKSKWKLEKGMEKGTG
jgi:hypothetical protein